MGNNYNARTPLGMANERERQELMRQLKCTGFNTARYWGPPNYPVPVTRALALSIQWMDAYYRLER